MPSFCRPERLERRLRRANVEIPPSSPLNTRVNNSAQPEQSLNLRVCRALLCTLYFLSPSHKKEQRVGLSLFITDNLSALRLDFQPTTRVSAAQCSAIRQPVTLLLTCGWCYMTTHQEEVLKEEDGRKWLLQKEKENESNIKRKAQKHKMHDTFSHTYKSIDTLPAKIH